MAKERSAKLDNIKGLLILLVVLGHFLTVGFRANNEAAEYIYCAIYSFHIPAFFMVSGFLSKKAADKGYNPAGIQKTFISYLLGTLIVICTVTVLYKRPDPLFKLTPVFAMWFLLSLLYMKLLVSWINSIRFAFPLSIALALAAGCSVLIGKEFALARTVCNMPYFLAGLKLAENNRYHKLSGFISTHKAVTAAAYAVILGAFLFLVTRDDFEYGNFWMYKTYQEMNYSDATGILYRSIVIAFAIATAALLMVIMPDKKCLLTKWGEASLVVYMLHTVFYYVLEKTYASTDFPVEGLLPLATVVIAAVITVMILSSKPAVLAVNGLVNRLTAITMRKK